MKNKKTIEIRAHKKTGEVGFCPNCSGLVDVAVDPNDRLDERIFKAVIDSGYLARWDIMQFINREIARAQVEIGEMGAILGLASLGPKLYWAIETAADAAKHELDFGSWSNSYIYTSENQHEKLWDELVDLLIVAIVAGKGIERLTGERRDLMRAAVERVENEDKRGGRKNSNVKSGF